jgi:5-methylcytosine-specific restriction enzyme A
LRGNGGGWTIQSDYFLIAVSPEEARREKEKARALRKTQWWLRQLAKGRCYYCGRPFPAGELTMDHIVPLIRGGKSTRGNTVPACKTCNNKKKYLLPIEWEDYLRGTAERSGPAERITDAGDREE